MSARHNGKKIPSDREIARYLFFDYSASFGGSLTNDNSRLPVPRRKRVQTLAIRWSRLQSLSPLCSCFLSLFVLFSPIFTTHFRSISLYLEATDTLTLGLCVRLCNLVSASCFGWKFKIKQTEEVRTMKRNKQTRNAIDTFFFHCERIYTVKGKKQGMAFCFLSAGKCDKARPPWADNIFPFTVWITFLSTQ